MFLIKESKREKREEESTKYNCNGSSDYKEKKEAWKDEMKRIRKRIKKK